MKLPKSVSDAEYLKSVVQTVLGAFQGGAGICDGRPEPMTFELAVQTLWREIDKTICTPNRDVSKLVRLRISKKSATLEELILILSACGAWTVRGSSRGGGKLVEGYTGATEELGSVVAHIVGTPNRKTSLAGVLGFLAEKGWLVTDLVVGA